MSKSLLGGLAVVLLAGCAFGDECVTMPPQASSFSGSTRGYWFVAPSDFTITGVQVLVATNQVHPFSNFAIVRFHNATPPPLFSATTNAFDSLTTQLNVPTGVFTPVEVDVLTGDVIGIYGNTMATSGAASGLNSYGNAPGGNFVEVFGQQVSLRRSGMQFHLGSANPLNSTMHDIWTEGTTNTSNITRIEFCYGAGGCYPDCDTSTGPGVLDIFDFLCFQNRYDVGSAYACDCDTSTGPGVCDIFDFLCFQNAYDAGCP